MTTDYFETGRRWWTSATRKNNAGPERNQGTPPDGPYDDFPDGPAAYRGQTDATLEKLFKAATSHAQWRIKWYNERSSERARVVKNIRSVSLLLFAAGTLAPIMVTLLLKFAELLGRGQDPDKAKWIWVDYLFKIPLAEIGYILLALAGALIVFDQFFDSSGSWIRFRQAQARLEVLLAELRFAWAERIAECGGNLDTTVTTDLVKLLRGFVTQIELLAEAETKEWAQRFSQRINAYDRNPNLRVALEREESASTTRNSQPIPGGAGNGNVPEQAVRANG